MRTEAHAISVDGLNPLLAAYAAIDQRPDPTGGTRDRIDQRGRLRYDHAWVRRPAPPPVTVTSTFGLCERDLRWLIGTGNPRRGRHARTIANAAAESGLFRLLYELDFSNARTRLGRLIYVEPRPDAQAALRTWLTQADRLTTQSITRLIDAVPPTAKAWANTAAPRLIAATAPTIAARTALVDELCCLATALPANGVPLSVLAAQTIRKTHGLDPGTNLGRLGARLAAAIAEHAPPANTTAVRDAWAAVGVWVDPVSSQVAGWRLPLNPDHPAAAVAAAYQDAGEPAVLTLGIIASNHTEPLIAKAAPPRNTLWVVEGISILTTIASHRIQAATLCRAGTPSVAATRIITEAAAAGWRIAVSSDFEPGGLRGAITTLRHAGPAGSPWRITATDYLNTPAEGERFAPEDVPETPWDPDLAATAMRHRRERASEEDRLTTLLADLNSQ
ncbi:hypothetical protein GCM10029978_066170 [Actinoallomurus acanthiterrae]